MRTNKAMPDGRSGAGRLTLIAMAARALTGLLAGMAEPSAAQSVDASTVVIRAANVLDGRGGRLATAAVVVNGDRIVAVLQGAAADSAARRAGALYDFGNATVLPGLIDVHVHISSYINAQGR